MLFVEIKVILIPITDFLNTIPTNGLAYNKTACFSFYVVKLNYDLFGCTGVKKAP